MSDPALFRGTPLQRKLNIDQALKGAKAFSEKYVERGHYEFFPEQEVVEVVQQGLAENQVNHGYRYCP
ncbi:MAG: hypothetical protein F4X65_04175 [Chloroflexi bacterium]|nr:hypothetical protein [Chloroflexota bacterium]